MASAISRGQVIFQDENAQVHGKTVAVTKGKSSVMAPKKNGAGLGSRKALNDITNKSKCLPQPRAQASSKKKIIEDLDISKEGFLHDHRKCVEEQDKQWDSYFSDLILYGQDSINKDDITEYQPKQMDDKEDNHNWDEVEEIPITTEFSDWLECSMSSPPCSPVHCSSPPSSPLSWRFGTIEFKIEEENGAI